MNPSRVSHQDATRSRLRVTVATIERELSRLRRQEEADGNSSSDGLLTSFADLVDQLALGPEPEVRECPVCNSIGMRAATLCGNCWATLTPPPDAVES